MSAPVVHEKPPFGQALAQAAPEPAISVRSVSKAFTVPHQQYHTLKERALHPFRSRTFDVLRAVDNVSVEIGQGEFFGIVGRNGSGKSTLLKCLAGIYDTDAGTISVEGRLSPFIELGVGFNPNLTARDNVIINAIMFGLTRKQARERFDDIIAFAELEDFLDLKLKNYSSGMHVRLAFSVAIQVDADILLIDEVLAVGDASFQQKCYEQFERMKAEGRTIVFVTHDMGAVERYCNRAMLLERGRMMDIGDSATIGRKYNELNFGRTVHAGSESDGRFGDRKTAEILAAWFENNDGERVTAVAQGTPCRACFEVKVHEKLENPIFGITLRNEVGHTVFASTSDWGGYGPTGTFKPGDTLRVRVRFDNWLAPTRYTLTPSVARAGIGADALDLRKDLTSLIVHATRVTGGVVDIPHTFEVRHT